MTVIENVRCYIKLRQTLHYIHFSENVLLKYILNSFNFQNYFKSHKI